jgi:alpha-mannosidase
LAQKTVHLICNAHLDPVWLWEWEEGAAAAVSTFRTAADLCEEFPGFVFNHNEAILYQWVEEYEPALFARIQRLVKEGKWRIMGGWHLQPDCNMPSGESFVRQILLGKTYFREKFGVEPTTAINFDPFGHTRGLVQILAKSGYDSYLHCRPGQEDMPLDFPAIVWVGFDGSEVIASRPMFYNSPLGKARQKVEDHIGNPDTPDITAVLWGVGNHGGGPSRQDLKDLRDLIDKATGMKIAHSSAEAYFSDLAKIKERLPRREKDMNPWGVGCYTSQVRIKQKHRLLENELYALEKMASSAAFQGLMEYPGDEIKAAMKDLATCEFHDILPGSSIQAVEDMSIRVLDHALENVSRARARAFYALAAGEQPAKEGEIPILVYNPHPFLVRTTVECEFQLADANWADQFTNVRVFHNGVEVAAQVEKEASNLSLDWRKRVVFDAELAPSQMNRFDCTLEVLPEKPKPALQPAGDAITFRTDEIEVVVNTKTGLLDTYRVNGVDYVSPNAFEPIVIQDNEDPWGMTVHSFRNVVGRFRLMSPERGTAFSGVTRGTIPSVRVIEDGAVRAVIESVFEFGDSQVCQRYLLPKQGTQIGVETRVHWAEKDKMLKLSVPVPSGGYEYLGQVAYGFQELPSNGDEAVAQKWTAVVSKDGMRALTCINDGIYGSDFSEDGLRLTLLRSPAYSAHPIFDRPLVPQDRYTPRIDQGERLFRFWFDAGKADERLARIDREALVKNEKPFAISFFPAGLGKKAQPFVMLSDDAVQMTAAKRAEDGKGLIVRLFEPTGHARKTTLSMPFCGLEREVSLAAFEIKTLRIDPSSGTMAETDLLERATQEGCPIPTGERASASDPPPTGSRITS